MSVSCFFLISITLISAACCADAIADSLFFRYGLIISLAMHPVDGQKKPASSAGFSYVFNQDYYSRST
ncbi:MAG TPA: hypothetical protein DCQ39_07685 [Lachnospiraceae bacterium]|nr:hypothetical protein [Lachnospiraceae bacterium]HAP73643.1 hypothetical protein [Lachnospiraceae bacterium]